MLKSFLHRSLQVACQKCVESKICNVSSVLNNRNLNAISLAYIHYGNRHFAIDKDLRDKKTVYKLVEREKLEEGHVKDLDDDDDDIVEGLLDSGLPIPTLETHDMLIKGVPYKELPIAHVRSTRNNTIIDCTDYTGAVMYAYSSCGIEGFRNVKKSTNVAAQATGLSVGYRLHRKGITHVRVIVKGLGVGRLPAITGLKQAGITVVSITDNTPVFHSGPKPRKAKRK